MEVKLNLNEMTTKFLKILHHQVSHIHAGTDGGICGGRGLNPDLFLKLTRKLFLDKDWRVKRIAIVRATPLPNFGSKPLGAEVITRW